MNELSQDSELQQAEVFGSGVVQGSCQTAAVVSGGWIGEDWILRDWMKEGRMEKDWIEKG